MTKYLLKRLLRGLVSVVIVVAIVMLLVYSLMNRDLIFAQDPLFSKRNNNDRTIYKYTQWEKYGYLDYVPYADYINELLKNGEIDAETAAEAKKFKTKMEQNSDITNEYLAKFKEHYEAKGYTVVNLEPVLMKPQNRPAPGGNRQIFATKDNPLISRLGNFFKRLITFDNINYVEDDMEDRGLTFTFYDPVYNTEPETGKVLEKKFSPAILGKGTYNKYLLYFDDQFPYIHQNFISVKLGLSFSVNQNVDVFQTMTSTQGSYVKSMVTYPTGLVEERADDLHTATYAGAGTKDSSELYSKRFTDDYTNVTARTANKSKLGFSFVIGIIASGLAYLIAVPMGIMMARKKDKLIDKIGTLYIIFILAVPSLAYIFMFKAIGTKLGLPSSFSMDGETWLMYLLPIISLALPSIANLMKWLRRYMIDQMNSDYVKFARSGGLSEREIFSKHILKNAAIPIIHGIPGSVLGSLVGAIITERVYLVPGAGNLLTEAINKNDNAVIVGLTLFYALISIVSVILGDILMAMADPRISFSSKAR